jgi:hypothetical protein
MPSFSSGRMQVAGGGQFADGTNSFDGTFGYGLPKSVYGKALVGRTSYDGSAARRWTSASVADTRFRSRPAAWPSFVRSRA